MPEIVENCPLCKSPARREFDRRTFRGEPVTNWVCAGCGLVYQSPRMTETETDAFYARSYRQVYQGQEGPNAKDLMAQEGRAQALLAFARPYLSQVTAHLDIGCSAGVLLQAFRRAYGCASYGVEPGDAYRAYAQAQGLTVCPSLETLAQQSPPRFSLISLAHVLEHLRDPLQTLSALRRDWLAPEGYLLIEVPNLYAHDSFEVAHLVSYSAHSLRETLQAAGYRLVVEQQHGQPRSALLPLYLSVLAQPLPQPQPYTIQAEHGVKQKRQWGMLKRAALTRLLPRRAWLPQPIEAPHAPADHL